VGQPPTFTRITKGTEKFETYKVIDESNVRLPGELQESAVPFGESLSKVAGINPFLLDYFSCLELHLSEC
jgi:hypothetical protein